MRVFSALVGFAAAAGLLFAAPAANAAIIGVAVDPSDNSVVGNTEIRPLLGGEAIKYFITLGNDSGVYGVDDGGMFGLEPDVGNGGGTLSMYLLFSPVTAGAEYTLSILFEDLDLVGANDPDGFLESVNVLSADGMTSFSGGMITTIGGMITGDADTQQLLTLSLGTIGGDPFLLRLDFQAMFNKKGKNTPEYLRAWITEVPIPGALPLFLAGLAGFGFATRRRKKAA